jgi:hypothetical protein
MVGRSVPAAVRAGTSGCTCGGILVDVDYDAAFDALDSVHLEDSWVLEVAPSRDGSAFRLETVLRPDHPLYEARASGEQYCYRNAWMEVASAEPIELDLSGATPARHASGTDDLGSIERFDSESDDERWVAEGHWGRANVRDPSVRLVFD